MHVHPHTYVHIDANLCTYVRAHKEISEAASLSVWRRGLSH